ncbi:uncharacterized protein [Palaemon carinicauda]|uniref:uncharacterized protein n=1 Tax=Palaemon carinicauda TaxID=392227 RepID=UPI0035B647EA
MTELLVTTILRDEERLSETHPSSPSAISNPRTRDASRIPKLSRHVDNARPILLSTSIGESKSTFKTLNKAPQNRHHLVAWLRYAEGRREMVVGPREEGERERDAEKNGWCTSLEVDGAWLDLLLVTSKVIMTSGMFCFDTLSLSKKNTFEIPEQKLSSYIIL